LLLEMSTLGQKLSYRLARHLRTAPWHARDVGPIVSFTFDDAPASAATHGAAILEESGIRGTYYLCGGLLGGVGDLSPILDRAQAKRLAEAGHEIGCHTYAHTDVRCRRWPALRSGLARNAEVLAEITGGAALRSFAYPHGGISFGKKLRLQSSFETCRGIYPGINVRKVDVGLLKAVPLYSGELDLAAALRWIEAAVSTSGWLVFFTHDVSDDPTPFGVTPDLLRSVVRSAIATGCACIPVGDAADRLRPSAGAARASERATGALPRPDDDSG
jgi:peptidoglycan/xylan/chitin deacetylase (PgdA/CDA1 family)